MVRKSILDKQVREQIITEAESALTNKLASITPLIELFYRDDVDDSLKRQFRYAYKELFEDGEGAVYIPQTFIEQAMASAYTKYILSRKDLTPKMVKGVIGGNDELREHLISLIQKDAVFVASSEAIGTDTEEIEKVDVYHFLSPRLSEAIFHLTFKPMPRNPVFAIEIDKTSRLFYVAVFAENGIIITHIVKNPNFGNLIPYTLDSSFPDEFKCYSKDNPYTIQHRKDRDDNEIKLSEVRHTLIRWLSRLARERVHLQVYSEFSTIMRNYDAAKRRRLNSVLSWIVNMKRQDDEENRQEDNLSWSFAVLLLPDDDTIPRHLVQMNVIGSSQGSPYENIMPYPFGYNQRGLSPRAYNLAQIISSGPYKRGTLSPNLYEKDIDSSIAIPSVSGEAMIGVLYVASTQEGYEFSASEELVLALLSYIIGEMVSNNPTHRESNLANYEQIIDNPLIMSPLFSGFFAMRQCKYDIEKLLIELPDAKDRDYNLLLIEIDVHSFRDYVGKDLTTSKFKTQLDLDRFVQFLGSNLFTRAVNSVFPDNPFNMPENSTFKMYTRRVYQLSLDRFAFIRAIHKDWTIETITQRLNEVFLHIHNDKYNAPGIGTLSNVYVTLCAMLFRDGIEPIEKAKSGETLKRYYQLDNRYIFAQLSHAMSLSSQVCIELAQSTDNGRVSKDDLENKRVGIVIDAQDILKR